MTISLIFSFIHHSHRFDRTKIRWSKDYKFLNKTKKYKISKKGALRILHVVFRDSGVYTCHAGLNAADIRLTIVAKTGSPMPNLDNDDYQDRHRDGFSGSLI